MIYQVNFYNVTLGYIICTGPVVIDAVDTNAYVVAAVFWQKLAGMNCIKRKQETIFLPRLAS